MRYTEAFESPLIRGEDIDARPWDLQAEITSQVHSGDNVLDIGSGTAIKLLPIAETARSVTGLEPSVDMRRKAAERIGRTALTNIRIIEGVSEDIPFDSDSFDVVTCMMAPHVTSEVHRVLKPTGLAILEKVGEQDKAVLKAQFPDDEHGKRGQFADLRPGGRKALYLEEFSELFSDVAIRQGFWSTYLSPEGLDLLLAETPTIRNFDPIRDKPTVDKAKEKLTTHKGILVSQHRILITAKK